MEIKAINTHYKGYKFRSRLEARWAVFFDALELDWKYEVEGFVLDGKPYLPDFEIYSRETHQRIFVEIKPEADFDDDVSMKCLLLSRDTGNLVFLCGGDPYDVFRNQTDAVTSFLYQRWSGAGLDSGDIRLLFYLFVIEKDFITAHHAITGAANAARAARFEHGERG